jgi:hypothetical protein
MPVDFTQIESGEDFELLCEDLLQAMGFTIVEKVALGVDGHSEWELGDERRVLRGGAFYDGARGVRCTWRYRSSPSVRGGRGGGGGWWRSSPISELGLLCPLAL